MDITLLTIRSDEGSISNKDHNAGFGTRIKIGNGIRARILEHMRKSGEDLPFITYGYLTAIFKKNNHNVKAETNTIPETDLIIMSCSLVDHKKEMEFIKRIKTETKSKLGLIGPFCSSKPELFEKYADFIIKGEPEEIAMKIKEDYIPKGLVESKPIMNLDTLPFPDWSLYNVKKFKQYPLTKKDHVLFMLASRGCPHLCNYCPYKVFGDFRVRSVKNVVDEIEYMIKQYGMKAIIFRDPVFSLKKERTKEIAEEIIKRNIKIEYVAETRLDDLNKDLIDILYKSGLRAIKVGVESRHEEVLKKSKRLPIEIKHQEEIIRYCEKIGIKIAAFYIIGLPGDTKKNILDTIKYSHKLNTYAANFNVCTPIPGTEFYENIKDKIYDHDLDHYDNFTPVFEHENLTKKEILKLKEKAFANYYFRFGYLLKFLRYMFK